MDTEGLIRKRLEYALWIEEVAEAALKGGDPIRDAYKAGCRAILKSLREALIG
jgi:hypothetical protein